MSHTNTSRPAAVAAYFHPDSWQWWSRGRCGNRQGRVRLRGEPRGVGQVPDSDLAVVGAVMARICFRAGQRAGTAEPDGVRQVVQNFASILRPADVGVADFHEPVEPRGDDQRPAPWPVTATPPMPWRWPHIETTGAPEGPARPLRSCAGSRARRFRGRASLRERTFSVD